MSEALFIRLLSFEDKDKALAEAIAATREGIPLNPVIYAVDPGSFGQVPGSPFAYWVSERIRGLFEELPPFESEGRSVKQGLATSDDFRFVRTWWEVASTKTLTGTAETTQEQFREQTLDGKQWVPFAKGGAYSPYYADLHLVVNWGQEGKDIKAEVDRKYSHIKGYQTFWVVKNPDFYFYPGLTWSRRTQGGLSLRSLPAGCIFADKGPAAFDSIKQLPLLLALTNSATFKTLVEIQMAFGSYEVGVIQRSPVPKLERLDTTRLTFLAVEATHLKSCSDISDETSHIFHLPALLQVGENTLAAGIDAWQTRLDEAQKKLTEFQEEIDDIAFRLYGISDEDRRAIESPFTQTALTTDDEEHEEAYDEIESEQPTTDYRPLTTDLISYFVGCAFGRWDARYATGERSAPELPDPFAPLPVCAPGALTGEDGLPLHEAPEDYPLRVDWDGILVDDPDHEDDMIRRVRNVLELVWKKRAEAIEHEACELLNVKTLRDYFRKPGNDGFWMQHVKRYSKSRRKAPIYWLLQSSKKNYALWLYYHRLDKDILFKALVNYVEPKLRLEETGLEQMRSQRAAGATGREARGLDRQIEKHEALLAELHDFHDKLRRAADLRLEPDLNDGVVLNIAPLWEMVPWAEAKKYWQELLAGKYEWSSISKQLYERNLAKAE